jgi:hypothetical protein
VDEIRRSQRQPALVALTEGIDPACLPFERFIARENAGRYRKALTHLNDRDRQLIVLRLERRVPYRDAPVRLSLSSEAAVRMGVRRALGRFARSLRQLDSRGRAEPIPASSAPEPPARLACAHPLIGVRRCNARRTDSKIRANSLLLHGEHERAKSITGRHHDD